MSLRAAVALALLALAGCAGPPASHDFSGGFVGVTGGMGDGAPGR